MKNTAVIQKGYSMGENSGIKTTKNTRFVSVNWEKGTENSKGLLCIQVVHHDLWHV